MRGVRPAGTQGAGDRWFLSGVLDEVALYNTALSGATIQEHYLLGD